MSTDAVILTLILFATIAALVAIRLTFRNAANGREALFTPTVFAVCGALLGISTGMIWFSERDGRVEIDTGIRLLVCGALLGTLTGAGVQDVYSRLSRGKTAAFVLMLVLLGGSIGAPLGWILGDASAPSIGKLEQFSASRMVWGIAIGSGVGLLLGLLELVFRRRGAT